MLGGVHQSVAGPTVHAMLVDRHSGKRFTCTAHDFAEQDPLLLLHTLDVVDERQHVTGFTDCRPKPGMDRPQETLVAFRLLQGELENGVLAWLAADPDHHAGRFGIRLFADHDQRAGCVTGELAADRSQHGANDRTKAAAAHDEHPCATRLQGQSRRRATGRLTVLMVTRSARLRANRAADASVERESISSSLRSRECQPSGSTTCTMISGVLARSASSAAHSTASAAAGEPSVPTTMGLLMIRSSRRCAPASARCY